MKFFLKNVLAVEQILLPAIPKGITAYEPALFQVLVNCYLRGPEAVKKSWRKKSSLDRDAALIVRGINKTQFGIIGYLAK